MISNITDILDKFSLSIGNKKTNEIKNGNSFKDMFFMKVKFLNSFVTHYKFITANLLIKQLLALFLFVIITIE